MAEVKEKDTPHPTPEELNPEPSDAFLISSSAATLSTIASSVSHLAVTEQAAPNLPLTASDQDMCCCPPKKIRISDKGVSVGSESSVHHEQTHPHGFDPSLDKESRRARYPDGKCTKNPDPLFGLRGAGSVNRNCANSLLEPSLDSNVKELYQGSCQSKNVLQDVVKESEGLCTPGLPYKEDALRWEKAGDRNPSCENDTSRIQSLTPSPLHCHRVGGKLAEYDDEGHCSSLEAEVQDPLLKSVGSSGDASHDFSSITESDRAATSASSNAGLVTVPSASASFVGQAQCPVSDVHSSLLPSHSEQLTVPMDISTDARTDSDPISCVPQHTGSPLVWARLNGSRNTGSCLPQPHRAGSWTGSSTSNYDAGPSCSWEEASSLVASAGCGKDSSHSVVWTKGFEAAVSPAIINPRFETDKSGAVISNTDDETDLSICSETSSDAMSSSSENSPRQCSVASARDFHRKLQCSVPESKTLGGEVHLPKKTPRYGLKTDAVDDVIGVARGGYGKSRYNLSSSKSPKCSAVKNSGFIKDTLTIDDLPNVLLIHIFSFLNTYIRISRIRQVCKRWQLTVNDPALWRRLDLRNLPRLQDDVLLQLASLSDRVSTLILSDGRTTLLTDDGVSRVLQKCCYLTKIKLNRCFFLSDDAFQSVGQHCHHVVYLNLSGCFTVTDRTLLAISQGCPLLEDLGLGQCARITDTGLCEVAKHCNRLVSLRLDQCGRLTNQALEALANHCPELQSLHLLSCAVTDPGIAFLSKLVKLRVLDISNVSQVSRRMVETVVSCCPLLETLALSLNRTVDDQCLRQVVTSCPKLRCLSCVACGLSDQGLHHIAQHARNLERLDVAWCADITDSGITEISRACPKLRYLGVMRCPLVTMATVERLVLEHPAIHYSNFELESRWLLVRAAEQGLAA